jgi:hypothetical protein
LGFFFKELLLTEGSTVHKNLAAMVFWKMPRAGYKLGLGWGDGTKDALEHVAFKQHPPIMSKTDIAATIQNIDAFCDDLVKLATAGGELTAQALKDKGLPPSHGAVVFTMQHKDAVLPERLHQETWRTCSP